MALFTLTEILVYDDDLLYKSFFLYKRKNICIFLSGNVTKEVKNDRFPFMKKFKSTVFDSK